jgi:hypothetical protein
MTLIITSIASDPIFAATFGRTIPGANLSLQALARLESSCDDSDASIAPAPRTETR